MNRKLLVLASLLGLTGTGPAAAAVANPATNAPVREPADNRDWFKLVTPNFQLYGNGRPNEARNALRELETFRHVVSRFLGLTNVQRRPALVFYFRDEASFTPFKPHFQGRPRPVSGFHVADPVDNVLALTRQSRSSGTMRVIFHEYTHLLTARQFRQTPLWAFEGIAEVFSTFEGSDDRFDIGVAMTNHVRFLQKQNALPVSEMLAIDRESPDYNENERAGRFYATAWLLTHHLVFGRNGYESNALPRYAALSSATTNRLAAFIEAFQATPEQLDAALQWYVAGGNYVMVRQTYRDLAEARAQEVRLEPGEVDRVLGRLLYLTDHPDPARIRLERAARNAPTDPRPRAALALLAWRQKNRAAIREQADEALRLKSDSAFVHYLAAEARYQDLARERPAAAQLADRLAEGRRLCERAIELDPWLAQAHHLLGVYVLTEHPKAPALAAAHVQQSLRCDPGYQPAILTQASLLAAQGNLGAARQILARLLASPLPPELREAALGIADGIERRLGSPGTSPRSP
jgi:hypothetical protein